MLDAQVYFEIDSMCRVARKHFSAVEPYRSDGLTLTLAGIKDMNVLFSNFAFVVSVRGLCQVMEAAQADPDLVFKLQVRATTIPFNEECIHLMIASASFL